MHLRLNETLYATQLFLKITNIQVFVRIVVSAGVTTISRFAPRMARNAIIVVLWVISPENAANRKNRRIQNRKLKKTNVNQIDESREKSDHEESVNYITSYQQLYEQVYDSNYDSNSDDYVAPISSDSVHQLEPLNVKIQLGEIKTSVMIDSGSAVSTITRSLANKISRSTKSAKWTNATEKRNLKTFSNEPIKVLGHLETTVIYNQWKDTSAMLTVVDDGHKNIIGTRRPF